MKPLPRILLIGLAICSSVLATPVMFTHDKAIELVNAISLLDRGYTKMIDQGQGSPPRVIENYPFEFSGKATLALTSDLSASRMRLQKLGRRPGGAFG